MYITFVDYEGLGYAVVPEAQFDRYEARAEQTVRKYTFDRIDNMDTPDGATEDVKRIFTMNRRGVCELMDLYFMADNPQSEEAQKMQVITGFHNGDYSESYLGAQRSDAKSAAPAQLSVTDVISLHFTVGQKYRGVGA